MTILQSELSRRIIRVASKPFIRGMLMSMSTKSGRSWRTFFYGFDSVAGFATDAVLRPRLNQELNGAPKQRVIIDN